MSKLLFLVFLSQLGHQLVAQGSGGLALSVQGDVRFSPTQPNPALGPKISLHYSPSDALNLSAVYSSGQSQQEHDGPTGTFTSGVSMQTYRLVAGWSPIGVKGLHMHLEVGAGLSSFSVPTRSVSLGAFGERTIQDQSDQTFTYSFGVSFQREIAPHIALHLSPEVLISPTSSIGDPVYCFGGGINVQIL